jgi:hypothetical protein
MTGNPASFESSEGAFLNVAQKLNGKTTKSLRAHAWGRKNLYVHADS